jgi:hypothetical protein
MTLDGPARDPASGWNTFLDDDTSRNKDEALLLFVALPAGLTVVSVVGDRA